MFSSQIANTALAFIVVSIVLIYFYVKHLYSYWQRRRVPYLKPTFPFGNFGTNFTQKLSSGEQVDVLYRATMEPIIGVHILLQPTLIVRDPKLIQNVLIKDFPNFFDRAMYLDEQNDPLSAHLIALQGERWKNLRGKLTPTFTPGKMKSIFSTLLECQDRLQQHLAKVCKSNHTVEVQELTACFTTNMIASVAFGIDIDCFADPETPFRKYGRQFFGKDLKSAFRFFCFAMNPKLLKWTRLRIMDREVEEFFFDVVKQTLELREKSNIVRKDFFQLLVQLRNGGIQSDDDWKTVIVNNNNKLLTIGEVTAQAFVFFMAGFETSATTMSFVLYLLAKHPKVQQMVQEEIDGILAQNDGTFTYNSFNELKYLDACIDESLRIYPAIPMLTRICTEHYKIPGMDVTIEKGTSIIIPVFSLHRDEKYYPNPETFDPSRFFCENKNGKNIIDMPYFPFGDGPRNCIGTRLGKMMTKLGIASILQEYTVELGEQHNGKDIIFSPATLTLTSKSGIHVKFIPRHNRA